MISQHMTIAEAVKNNPDIINPLSEYGIDYCCEGAKKLSDAMKVNNIDPDILITQLNNVRDPDTNLDFKKALRMDRPEDRKKLIAHIIKHHHRLEEKLLSEIGEYLPILLRVHYEEHSDELSRLYKKFSQLNAELTVHLANEERAEFQRILEDEDFDRSAMLAEHDIVAGLLHDVKRMTNNFTPPPDCCQTYELAFARLKELYEDIHQHFFLENNILFV